VRLGWLGTRPASSDAHDAHLIGIGPTRDDADLGTLAADHPITMAGMPAVNPAPPRAANGHVTFGVLGPVAAVGHTCVATWKAVLNAVPDAKLLVANFGRMDNETVDRIYTLAAHVGLGERVTVAELEDEHAPRAKFMDYIDIVLDTMPHSGFTETGEALWMGVPALAASGSAGARALAAAGKTDWVYSDLDNLRETACQLAGDVALLHAYRQNLRLSLADTPLFDVGAFTRNLETAYRTHWARWCAVQTSA